ncbi:V-type ATP synthase subunit C [uncultured archaeon]|nr:V-type ATP synthase subunit C [uncultured archaeon]
MGAKVNDEDRVEMAVSKNFARTAQKILRITPEASKATLAALLTRYDVLNLKTILLARKLGRNKEEAEKLLVPAGSISREALVGMASAKSPDELYELIRTSEFGKKFLSSVSITQISKAQIKAALQSAEEGKLEILLAALDSYYYHVVSSSVKAGDKDGQAILQLVRSETDSKNVMTMMRLKRGGADKRAIMKCMVPGGSFTARQLEKMASAKDVPEIAAVAASFFISETGRGEFAAASERYKKDSQLSHFEVVFENSIARRSLHALRRSMMSVGAIAGFLFLKEEEMNNIRKIVRGKALGLSPEKISEMLVLVG